MRALCHLVPPRLHAAIAAARHDDHAPLLPLPPLLQQLAARLPVERAVLVAPQLGTRASSGSERWGAACSRLALHTRVESQSLTAPETTALPAGLATVAGPARFARAPCRRGLNAPDPTLPPAMRGGADPALEISGEGLSLAAFAHAKLALKVHTEFEQPADLLNSLHGRELLPCNGFAPTPYKTIKQR